MKHTTGEGVLVVALLAALVACADPAIAHLNQAVPTGLTIAGVSLITYGGWRLGNAYRALSKSVWWYNRDLKKSADQHN
jgi:hypothetical protein